MLDKKEVNKMLLKEFQFDYKNCNIDVSQIEDSKLYHIEIFPDNQTLESFESYEFAGIFNIEIIQ